MKMTSFAMLVTTSMLAVASVAYVAPALAEDDNTMQTMPAPADNNTQDQNQNNDMSNPPANNNMGNPSANNMSPGNDNNSSSTDQATPDTATGDDDY